MEKRIQRFRRGFTIVELMVVIAILGVLAAISAPLMGSLIPAYRADGATKALSTELQNIRQRAIAKNTTHKVEFKAGTTQQIVVTEVVAEPGGIYKNAASGWSETYTLGGAATATTARSFPNIELKKPVSDPLPDVPLQKDSTQAASFGPDEAMVVYFFPNGRSNESGGVFFTPLGKTGPDNTFARGIEVIRAGMIRTYEWGEGKDADGKSVLMWKEF